MGDQEKPGIKTSEFWTKNAVQALVVVGALTHRGVDEKTAAAVVAGLELAYIAGRTLVKAIRGAVQAVAAARPGPQAQA